ncbi:HEPN domain-containing protein [Candidatus Aerophobetes bacterium]|nr:HEPN domain-containing protein [Candidatus Aerophobetes bacterium]
MADELVSYQEKANLREAYLRSAMSRCYYGIFCIARNHLIAKNIPIPRVDTHKFVREKYQKSTRNIEKKIAKNLRRLWKERKDADYEDKTDIDIQRAKTALYLSKRTLKNLQQIGAT